MPEADNSDLKQISRTVIYEATDYYGNKVALTDEGELHVILHEHDEVTREQIKRTIEETPWIVKDKTYRGGRRNYYRILPQHPEHEEDYLAVSKVTVKNLPFEDYDIVKTAYVITNLEGEINPGGKFLYDPGTGSE